MGMKVLEVPDINTKDHIGMKVLEVALGPNTKTIWV
jgi:hypothetical protein